MGILSWILLGLIAGVLAKWIVPGPNPGGWIVTMVIGIIGAFIGGWLGNMTGIGGPVASFSIGSIITATVGAIVLLAIFHLVKSQ